MITLFENPKPYSEMNPALSSHHSQAALNFSRFAAHAAVIAGSASAFLVAVASIVIWAATGPYFHFSNGWQLVVNTSTTIVTFLMVFLIQNTQNRDTRALQLKLDEIIRSHSHARNEMIDIEKLSDAELEELAKYYERIRRECDERSSRRAHDLPSQDLSA